MQKTKLILLTFCMTSLINTAAWSSDLTKIRTKPLPGTVTLTFDDGPNQTYTNQILDILKKNKINATFFVMGAIAEKDPTLIQKMAKQGNVIADHSITHPLLTKLSDKKLQYEIGHSKEQIAKALGQAPVCFRPPFFGTNAKVRGVIKQNDMVQILGFMTEDYQNRGTDWLVNNVLTHVHAGSILVLHDGYKSREQTVAALPRIIEGIKKKGLGFSVICEQSKQG